MQLPILIDHERQSLGKVGAPTVGATGERFERYGRINSQGRGIALCQSAEGCAIFGR